MKISKLTYKLSAIQFIVIVTVVSILVSINIVILKKSLYNKLQNDLKNYTLSIAQIATNINNDKQVDSLHWAQINQILLYDIYYFNSDSCIHIDKETHEKITGLSVSFNDYYRKLEKTDSAQNHYFIHDFTVSHNKQTTQKYYAYLVYLPKTKSFIASVHQRDILNSLEYNNAAIIIMLFVFGLLIIAYMIWQLNIRYVNPYGEITEYLKQSKYVKFHANKNKNEVLMIKRSIELLHNQIDFFSKKINISTKETQKIENDLRIAKRLQTNILPKKIHEIKQSQKIELDAFSESAFDIGGDLYDYFFIDSTHLLFVVGDVSGKGIPAALFMIYTQTVLRSVAKAGMQVSEIAENLNDKLTEENLSDLFVTMFLGIVDTQTGSVTYCNAAHNYPMLIRQKGTVDEMADSHGIPLGLYPNRKYSQSEIALSYNDQIFIYTDGIIDSKDENGMKYSVDVLKYNLVGSWFLSPVKVIEKVKKSIYSFRGNVGAVDDMTMLLIKYTHETNKSG